jgi:cytochrome subunit of sulfide dehydrogenase
MKYKKLSRAILLVAGGLTLGGNALAIERGEMLANTCAGCHGVKGASGGPAIPTIGGIKTDTFIEAMKGYKEGRPGTTIMDRIAKGFSDEEIALMADYFAKQTFVRHAQPHNAAQAKKGAKLHDKYCDKCHEEGGKKDEDGSSILAGQWLPYLQYQLADFKSGQRDMSKKMASSLEKMVKENGEGSLDDIAHYYASQK